MGPSLGTVLFWLPPTPAFFCAVQRSRPAPAHPLNHACSPWAAATLLSAYLTAPLAAASAQLCLPRACTAANRRAAAQAAGVGAVTTRVSRCCCPGTALRRNEDPGQPGLAGLSPTSLNSPFLYLCCRRPPALPHPRQEAGGGQRVHSCCTCICARRCPISLVLAPSWECNPILSILSYLPRPQEHPTPPLQTRCAPARRQGREQLQAGRWGIGDNRTERARLSRALCGTPGGCRCSGFGSARPSYHLGVQASTPSAPLRWRCAPTRTLLSNHQPDA
jgi:hypothetical protein